MKRLTAIYMMLLAVGLMGSEAWAQQYQLPSGVRAGQHRTKEFHGTGRASFHALKVGQSARRLQWAMRLQPQPTTSMRCSGTRRH